MTAEGIKPAQIWARAEAVEQLLMDPFRKGKAVHFAGGGTMRAEGRAKSFEGHGMHPERKVFLAGAAEGHMRINSQAAVTLPPEFAQQLTEAFKGAFESAREAREASRTPEKRRKSRGRSRGRRDSLSDSDAGEEEKDLTPPRRERLPRQAKGGFMVQTPESCRDFGRFGSCRFGDRCMFEHLRERPDQGWGGGGVDCRNFARFGSCRYGNNCRFQHHAANKPTAYEPRQRSEQLICFDWRDTGDCRFGERCRFGHNDQRGPRDERFPRQRREDRYRANSRGRSRSRSASRGREGYGRRGPPRGARAASPAPQPAQPPTTQPVDPKALATAFLAAIKDIQSAPGESGSGGGNEQLLGPGQR